MLISSPAASFRFCRPFCVELYFPPFSFLREHLFAEQSAILQLAILYSPSLHVSPHFPLHCPHLTLCACASVSHRRLLCSAASVFHLRIVDKIIHHLVPVCVRMSASVFSPLFRAHASYAMHKCALIRQKTGQSAFERPPRLYHQRVTTITSPPQ